MTIFEVGQQLNANPDLKFKRRQWDKDWPRMENYITQADEDHIYDEGGENWNPCAADLAADDWEPVR